MSDAELELLKKLDIPQKVVAAALKVTPQRISQGMKREDWYLTPARLRALYLHLTGENESKAEEFRKWALDIVPTPEHREALQQQAIPATADPIVHPGTLPRPWETATEMWVFSSRPKEVEDLNYRDQMEKKFFLNATAGISSHSIKRIVYFVTPAVVSRLCRYLGDSFRRISPENRTEVIVVESAAISICPKFVIYDPLKVQPWGYVLGEGGGPDFYAKLSSNQLVGILDGLKDGGVGGRKKDKGDEEYDFVIVPPFRAGTEHTTNELNLTIQFTSRDVKFSPP